MTNSKNTWSSVPCSRIATVYGSGQNCKKTEGAKNHRSSGCCKFMTIATYNGRSLSNESRLQELEEELDKIRWDIIGLSEIRRKGEEEIELNSGHILYYRGTNDGRTSGVGFLVHKKWKNHITEVDSASDRVARLVIRLSKRYSIQFIQVYAPTKSYSDEEVDEFYEEVSKMKQKNRHHLNIIMGDFNARIGEKRKGEVSVGNYGYDTRNDRGNRLVEFAETEQLYIMNSFFKKKPQRKWTWRCANGAVGEIDYILANKKYIVQDCSVLNKFNTGSDHRMVRCKIQLNTKIERMKLINKSRKQVDILQLKEQRCKFRLELKNRFEALKNIVEEEEHVSKINRAISETLKVTALEVAGEVKKRSTKKITEVTRQLMKKRREMKPKKDDPISRIEYIEICKTLRKHITEDVRKFNCELVKKAVENNKSLKGAKRQLGIGKKGIFALKTEEGFTTKNRSKIVRIVEDFYNKLYHNEEEDVDIEQGDEDVPHILQEEVAEAIQSMKKGKAPGKDGVTIDIIKEAGEELYNLLASLFTKCIKYKDVPEDWKSAMMVLLFKKGDKEDIRNYRPISLLSTMYKIFTKILTNRIQGTLDFAQPREQAGFRSGYSTMDNIQVLRELIERHKEYELPLCFAFIDYEKAFDSVYISAVIKALKNNGVNSAYTKVLRKIYSQSSATVPLNKGEAKIKICKGVRQGDTISPKLFTAVLEEIFKKLDWETKGLNINGEYLNHLRFADDIVLISSNATELQEMMQELENRSKEIGLRMNLNKTKVMYNDFAFREKIITSNVEVEQVNSYIYLGQEISMDGSIMNEINRRIRIAWSTFGKNSLILRSKLPICLKRKVFNQCVLPALTYGAETWTLTRRSMQRLQTTQRSMERCMLGITRKDKKRISWIRNKTKVIDVIQRVKNAKWSWAGHIARRTDNRWTSLIMDWYPRDKKRPRRRPQNRWKDEIRKQAGVNWKTVALDRKKWKCLLGQTFIQQWIENG